MGTNLTTFIKILFFIFIGLIAVTGLLMIDDELSKESKLLLEDRHKDTDQTGYFYLMGIMAAENENPIEVGRALFESIQYKKEKGTISVVYEKYPKEKELPLPEGELYCKFHDENCMTSIFQNIKNFNENDSATLLNRYLAYLSFNDHDLITQAHPEEPIPPYRYLISGSQSFLLKNIHLSINGEPEIATDNIENHIELIRGKLKNSSNLIEKMIFTSILSQNIDTLYAIAKQSDVKITSSIHPLTTTEIDFSYAIKREFKGMTNYLVAMDKNGNLLSNEYYLPGFIVRVIYKPNMTLNLMAPKYLTIIANSHLTPFELVEIVSNKDSAKNDNIYSIRNIVGNILSKINQPEFSTYIFRLHDLNIKISLFNKTVNLTTNETKNIEIENPYYKTIEKPIINKDKLCLSGPIEDRHTMRCLPII